MIDIYLIRHSITYGNTLGRYIGKRTDEPLCEEGIALLRGKTFPAAEAVFVSPMKRCIQTASLLYPHHSLHTMEDLAECDFGIFENKNYKELEGNPYYQEWIDSNGELAFPGGESRAAFSERCQRGFGRLVESCIKGKIAKAAAVVHGGSIMSILEAFAEPHRDYYDWKVGNGQGYHITLLENEWKEAICRVQVVEGI